MSLSDNWLVRTGQSLASAERARRAGRCTQDQFDEYCYHWRTSTGRFTDTGLAAANRWAKKNGLDLLESVED
jgi:hypothetical protein